MDESTLLAHIYDRSATLAADFASRVAVGPGDDCAVLRLTSGAAPLLVTTDQLVEGRHYDPATPISSIAHKAICRSLSDIAAMGARAHSCVAAATLRAGFEHADELFDAMARTAARYDCPLVGGDIAVSDGPTVLCVTVLGEPHDRRGPALRSDAKPGDIVCVTGAVGGSFVSGKHLTFEPRLREADWLCDTLGDRLGAMIDLSDGVGRDAGRVAAASRVRIMLDEAEIPLAPSAKDARSAIADGEDYELLFTVRPGADIPSATPTGVAITAIGSVEPGAGCVFRLRDGAMIDAAKLGWDHHS